MYDDAFFANRVRFHARIAYAVSDLLMAIPKPTSAIDVGCGDAHWLKCLSTHNVPTVLGIEGFPACLPYTKPIPTIIHDLSTPLPLSMNFDLVLCIEVGEHLPERAAPTLVETCTNLVKTGHPIVFSAAPPGQGGVGHVNLQPKSYWRDLFQAHGFEESNATYLAQLWNESGVMPWLYKNVMIFKRYQ